MVAPIDAGASDPSVFDDGVGRPRAVTATGEQFYCVVVDGTVDFRGSGTRHEASRRPPPLRR